MPRGRSTGTLARLEQRLARLDAQRHRVIANMQRALSHLTLGSAAPLAGLDLDDPFVPAAPARRTRRALSPESRARLSQLAKARWAKAKKAGKTRL